MKKVTKSTILMTPVAVGLAACLGGCFGDLGNAGAQANPAPNPVAPGVVMKQIHDQHPDLANQLLAHLRSKYPNLEARFLRAVLSLHSKYPGLVYSLPRHLIEDLNGEPLQALQDVLEAESKRYPNFRQRIAELRRQGSPARATVEHVVTRYPQLRTEFLEWKGQNPGPRPQIGQDVRTVIQQQFPDLRRQVVLEVSHLIDEKYPGLPAELFTQCETQRPLPYLLKNHPDFVRDAVSRVSQKQGPQLRKAAVAVLSKLESDPAAHPGPWAAKALEFVVKTHPTLLPELVDKRMAARQKLMRAVKSEFPEAAQVALDTMKAKHPDLAFKALASVQMHYPNLRADFRQALDTELPGIRQEARTFLQSHYPDVAEKLPPL